MSENSNGEEPGKAKRLYKSRDDKVFAGVCGGLAEYLEMEPTIVRLLTLLSFMCYGVGALIYVAAAFVIPGRPKGSAATEVGTEPGKSRNRNWSPAVGFILVTVGLFFLLSHFNIIGWHIFQFHFVPWRIIWPLLFIAVGIYLVTSSHTVNESAQNLKNWAKDSRLHKSREDRIIAGVCGGLAEQLKIDPSVVRILYILATIITAGVFGLLLYVALAIILPEESRTGEKHSESEPVEAENGNGKS